MDVVIELFIHRNEIGWSARMKAQCADECTVRNNTRNTEKYMYGLVNNRWIRRSSFLWRVTGLGALKEDEGISSQLWNLNEFLF